MNLEVDISLIGLSRAPAKAVPSGEPEAFLRIISKQCRFTPMAAIGDGVP